MMIKCPKCHKTYEHKVFGGKDGFFCSCGERLSLKSEQIFYQLDRICKEYELRIEEENIARIRKTADRIVSLIFNDACTKLDVDIEKTKLKQLIEQVSPDKAELYTLIYEPRFKRLWEQFRGDPDSQE